MNRPNRDRDRLARYYRYLVIAAMRDAGCTLKFIGEHFLISAERVRQLLKRGPVPAQLMIPIHADPRD